MRPLPRLALGLVLSLSGLALHGQARFPAHETFVYARSVGGVVGEERITFDLVPEKDRSKAYWEVKVAAADQTSLFRLDALTLLPQYSEVTTTNAEGVIRRTTTILQNRATVKSGEILIGGFETLVYELRGLAWASTSKVRLVFLGASQGASPFAFDLSVVGKETLQVGGRSIPCYKATLSLSGFWGSLVGKSYLWYSADAAHYLVRSEGASGPPGSPQVTMTLESYSSL